MLKLLIVPIIFILAACGGEDVEYSLEFNHSLGQFGSFGWRIPNNYIQIPITQEEAEEIFPGVDLNFSMIVVFDENGYFWALYGSEYTRVRTYQIDFGAVLDIGQKAYFRYFAADEKPLISNFYGVYVTANFTKLNQEYLFGAKFYINDIAFNFTTSQRDFYEGKRYMEELVKMFALNRPNFEAIAHLDYVEDGLSRRLAWYD